ncbi:MAG TPA: hypothetical protein VGG10_02315 [Rhizomicrobium sp.]|jgi:hypothetical protein
MTVRLALHRAGRLIVSTGFETAPRVDPFGISERREPDARSHATWTTALLPLEGEVWHGGRQPDRGFTAACEALEADGNMREPARVVFGNMSWELSEPITTSQFRP